MWWSDSVTLAVLEKGKEMIHNSAENGTQNADVQRTCDGARRGGLVF